MFSFSPRVLSPTRVELEPSHRRKPAPVRVPSPVHHGLMSPSGVFHRGGRGRHYSPNNMQHTHATPIEYSQGSGIGHYGDTTERLMYLENGLPVLVPRTRNISPTRAQLQPRVEREQGKRHVDTKYTDQFTGFYQQPPVVSQSPKLLLGKSDSDVFHTGTGMPIAPCPRTGRKHAPSVFIPQSFREVYPQTFQRRGCGSRADNNVIAIDLYNQQPHELRTHKQMRATSPVRRYDIISGEAYY